MYRIDWWIAHRDKRIIYEPFVKSSGSFMSHPTGSTIRGPFNLSHMRARARGRRFVLRDRVRAFANGWRELNRYALRSRELNIFAITKSKALGAASAGLPP